MKYYNNNNNKLFNQIDYIETKRRHCIVNLFLFRKKFFFLINFDNKRIFKKKNFA